MDAEIKLKKLIENKFDNLKHFSETIDLPYTTVRSIIQRGILNAKVENVIKICDGLGIKSEDLLRDELDDREISEQNKNDMTVFVDKECEEKHIKLISNSIELPFYPSVAAGALAEMESVDVWNIDTISIPTMMLDSYAETKGLFAMRVNGDSMDNVIPHKSIIVVKPVEQSIYKDGDIVVFSYNQKYSLKRYRPNIIKDFVIFEPDSTDGDFKSIPINKKDLYESNEVSVYGKVIFFSTTL